MKTSPLTSEELACMQEGLKVYKHDWMSIWRLIVPHRDPSLLPRQWHIALGTQKSYKLDAAQKEKRRLYESKRRNSKVADLASCQNKEDGEAENSGEENNTASCYTEDAGKSYVHEAFLAVWRPNISTAYPLSNLVINPRSSMPPQDSAPGLNASRFGEAPHAQTSNNPHFPQVSKNHQYPSFPVAATKHSGFGSMKSNNIIPHVALNASMPQFYLRPYRARKTNVARLVKLAPDLPPVNLPSSVRVVSQSAFKGPISAVSPVVPPAGRGGNDSHPKNIVSQNSRLRWLETSSGMEARKNQSVPLKDGLTTLHTEESRFVTDKGVEQGKTTKSDLQMHPLLFQAPEDGCLPYCPLKCSTNDSSSFSFFSGRQPHLNLSLLHNPQKENHVDCVTKSLKSVGSSSVTGY